MYADIVLGKSNQPNDVNNYVSAAFDDVYVMCSSSVEAAVKINNCIAYSLFSLLIVHVTCSNFKHFYEPSIYIAKNIAKN